MAIISDVGRPSFQGQAILKKPEKSLPKEQRKISRAVKQSSFLNLVDQVLEAFELRVVTHSFLAGIVCNGDLRRACTALRSKDSISEDSSSQEYQTSFSLQTEMMSSAVDQTHAILL